MDLFLFGYSGKIYFFLIFFVFFSVFILALSSSPSEPTSSILGFSHHLYLFSHLFLCFIITDFFLLFLLQIKDDKIMYELWLLLHHFFDLPLLEVLWSFLRWKITLVPRPMSLPWSVRTVKEPPVGDFPVMILLIIVLCDHNHFLCHQVGRIKANTKLSKMEMSTPAQNVSINPLIPDLAMVPSLFMSSALVMPMHVSTRVRVHS